MEAPHLDSAQKKAKREGRLIVFIDESGLSERPTRVRNWAPKGCTPVIEFHFNWTHLSVIAALSPSNVLFRLHKGSVKKEQAVEFLKALKAHLKQPLLVMWDGLRAHRSHLVRDYANSLNGQIHLASLPAYSPDLNPIEYLWARLKRHALANYCPNGLAELKTTARNKLRSAQHRPLDHRLVLGAGGALRLSLIRERSIAIGKLRECRRARGRQQIVCGNAARRLTAPLSAPSRRDEWPFGVDAPQH